MEFLAAEVSKFQDVRRVRRVLQILDWTDRRITYGEDGVAYGIQKPIEVTRELLASALRHHHEVPFFQDIEVAIRDDFDAFLDGLIRFDAFVRNRLVTPREIDHFLGYWFKIVAYERRDPKDPALEECLRRFWQYADLYGYGGVRHLLSSVYPEISNRFPKVPDR